MTGRLSWTREGETLALHGELGRDLLVPPWEARARATEEATVIDLSQITRADTAGLALLVHFVALIRRQGREVQLTAKSKNLQTLIGLCNLLVSMISQFLQCLSVEAIPKAPIIFSSGLFACLRPRHLSPRCWVIFIIK